MSTLQVTNIRSQASATLPSFQDSTGVEYGRLCRASILFNGSTNTIYGSFNVSSVTKNGTGNYTINFTRSLPDANYSVVTAMGDGGSTGGYGWGFMLGTISANNCIVASYNASGGSTDRVYESVAIFR